MKKNRLKLVLLAVFVVFLPACGGGGGGTPNGGGGMIIPKFYGEIRSGYVDGTCSAGYAAGVATGYSSRSFANSAAASQCRSAGGRTCEAFITFSSTNANQKCAALAFGRNRAGGCDVGQQPGSTREAAEAAALRECRDRGYSCGIVTSACSITGPANSFSRTSGDPGGNRQPAVGGGFSDVTVQQGRSQFFSRVSEAFRDPDGDRLDIRVSSNAPNFATATYSASSDRLTIEGRQAFTSGAVTITVTATDPGGLSASTTFTVRVTRGSDGSNDDGTDGNRQPAVGGGFSDVTVQQGRSHFFTRVSRAFRDPDGDDLTIRVSSNFPNFATASYSASSDQITIRGVQSFTTGAVTVTVTATDPGGLSTSTTFTVRVTQGSGGGNTSGGGNRSPVVVGGFRDTSIRQGESTRYSTSGVFRDPDGDRLDITARSNTRAVRASVSRGTLVVEGLQAITGAATITVTATDPAGLSASTTFAVRVTAAPRQWGYYAITGSSCQGNGQRGWSLNSGYSDQASAERAARDVCRSRGGCPTSDSFANRCIGIATWNGCGYATRGGSSSAAALSAARAACRGRTNCRADYICAGNAR